jgi:hypothetical protein
LEAKIWHRLAEQATAPQTADKPGCCSAGALEDHVMTINVASDIFSNETGIVAVPSEISVLSNRANSERELAQGVTKWLTSNFGPDLAAAVRNTPFTPALLCAIACREAGAFWLPLTPHKAAADILALAIYDASGDVAGAPRSAFPVNTSAFRLAFGDDFTNMLVQETNNARAARGLRAASIVYKGYGIFQYDLQSVRTDESFFRDRKWHSFTECVGRAVAELTSKFNATHDIHDTVRAYNGSGPKAEQYARDVLRILPFCEEAIASAGTTPGLVTAGAQGHDFSAGLDHTPVLAAMVDTDPAAPGPGEGSETADSATATMLANIGAGNVLEDTMFAGTSHPLAAGASPLLRLDLAKAKAFLSACEHSTPRVTYRLGAKVPFLGAVPGRDFTEVDCSGFIREMIRLSTTPTAAFPDGSVVQHDWIRSKGFEKASVADGLKDDGVIRIAFLRPQDTSSKVGHVLLLSAGMTLESHSGVGPDSRRWTGTGFQAKMLVYVLSRP